MSPKEQFPDPTNADEAERIINEILQRLQGQREKNDREKVYVLDILPGIKRDRILVAARPFEFPNPVHVAVEGKRIAEQIALRTDDEYAASKARDCERFFNVLSGTIAIAKRHLVRAEKINNHPDVDLGALHEELEAAADAFTTARNSLMRGQTRTWEDKSRDEKLFPGGTIDSRGKN